jgi:ubiquinone biosynthesis protein COQ4
LVPTRNDSDVGYLCDHIRESHDLWHVVTGFDTDVAGELGVQALYVAQLRAPFGLLLLALGLMNSLATTPHERDHRMRAVVRGWLLGKRARPLFGVPWADLWGVRVETLQRAFGLEAAEIDRFLSGSGSIAERRLWTKPRPVDVQLAHARP